MVGGGVGLSLLLWERYHGFDWDGAEISKEMVSPMEFVWLGVMFTCGGRWLKWLADGRRGKCNTDGRNRVMIY